jgi:hypothetical protein
MASPSPASFAAGSTSSSAGEQQRLRLAIIVGE